MTDTITIPNWRRFQHYGKEKPPWIKLYRDALSDYEMMHKLAPAERWVLVGLWLLAASSCNATPYDANYLTHALNADVDDALLLKLQTLGFIEVGGLSRVGLEKVYAKTETETETETEKRLPAGAVRDVFDYWVNRRRETLALNGGPSPVLNAKRSKRITDRLREGYDVPTLKRAVDGCMASDFHVKGGYLDIELICRDASKVDAFLIRTPDESGGELGVAHPLPSGGFYVGN